MFRARILSFLASLACVSMASAASGLAVGPRGGPAPSRADVVEIVCNDDCGPLALPDAPADFDLAFAARLTRAGVHVELSTAGQLLVRGPVRATGDVFIEALEADFRGGTIETRTRVGESIGGSITLNADRNVLTDWTQFDVPDSGTVRFVDAPSVRLGAGNVVGRATGGTLVLGGGIESGPPAELFLLDAGLVLDSVIPAFGGGVGVSAIEAAAPAAPSALDGHDAAALTWRIHLQGDVYLDLSAFELGSLRLTSKRTIRFTDAAPDPVPEPGPALLLGFGLAALSGCRRE
ncbi:MAG: hypothetical protein AAGC67_04870 [Myxococcota bacterium]